MFSRLQKVASSTCKYIAKMTTMPENQTSIVPKLVIPSNHLSIIQIGTVDKNNQFYVSYFHKGVINTWMVKIQSKCYLIMIENENFEEILKFVPCNTSNAAPIWTKVPNCQFDGFVISDMTCYHRIAEPISYEWRLKSGERDWEFDYFSAETMPIIETRTIRMPLTIIDNYFPTK